MLTAHGQLTAAPLLWQCCCLKPPVFPSLWHGTPLWQTSVSASLLLIFLQTTPTPPCSIRISDILRITWELFAGGRTGCELRKSYTLVTTNRKQCWQETGEGLNRISFSFLPLGRTPAGVLSDDQGRGEDVGKINSLNNSSRGRWWQARSRKELQPGHYLHGNQHFYWALLCTKPFAKRRNTFFSITTLWGGYCSCPIYRWENWGSERLKNLLRNSH